MSDRSLDRERRVVSALKALWSPPADSQSGLLVGDLDGHLDRHLMDTVPMRSRWCRWTTPEYSGSPWPASGPHSFATLRLPREKDTLHFCIETIAAHLPPGAPFWVYGANDEGIKSTGRHLGPFFDDVHTVGSKHHCRVWSGRRTSEPARSNLQAWATQSTLELPSGPRPWIHLPGVFAKGGLDPATALLLSALETQPAPGTVLDFACGGGVIAAELNSRWPDAKIDGLDADAVALETARSNAQYHNLHLSDGWSNLGEKTYGLIVSNPPIHRGKSENHDALNALIEQSQNYLRPQGRLWVVGQRRLGLSRRFRGHSTAHCEADDGRFQVWSTR